MSRRTTDQGIWFEELARIAVARELGVALDDVRSGHLQGVSFPGDPEITSQIDFYVVEDRKVAEFLVIVDAKWRSRKVSKLEVRNWAHVAQEVRASKAILFSNMEFTEGALAVARASKIATTTLDISLTAAAVPHRERQVVRDAFESIAVTPGAVL